MDQSLLSSTGRAPAPATPAFDLVNLEFDLLLWGRGVEEHAHLVTAALDGTPAERRTYYRAYYAAWNLTWAIGTTDELAVVAAAASVLDH